jgi:hypothetical protein
MVVKTYRDGLGRTALHIGDANARRYFSRRAPSIELRLDDLHIQCTLPPDFWQGRALIHDPRLSEWLEFKVARRAAAGSASIPLTLVPFGIDAFVVGTAANAQPEAFGAEVSLPRMVHSEPRRSLAEASPLEELSVA